MGRIRPRKPGRFTYSDRSGGAQRRDAAEALPAPQSRRKTHKRGSTDDLRRYKGGAQASEKSDIREEIAMKETMLGGLDSPPTRSQDILSRYSSGAFVVGLSRLIL